MDQPRFSQHLPSGSFLDWSFGRAVESGQRPHTKAAPSLAVAVRYWDVIDDTTAAHIAGSSIDTELLEWIAGNGTGRNGVRRALLSNPALPFGIVRELLDAGITPAENDAVRASRTPSELGQLHLTGHRLASGDRQAAQFLAAHVAETGTAVTPAMAVAHLEIEHHPTFLNHLLRGQHITANFCLDSVLDVLDGCAPQTIPATTWRGLGEHLATRGTRKQMRRALALSDSTSLRAPLLEARSIAIGMVFAGLAPQVVEQLLQQLPGDHRLGVDETTFVVTLPIDAKVLHELRCTPEAATWAAVHADGPAAGALVWQSDSDSTLVSVLRHNTHSHRWAVHHVWRIGRIWHRLSARVRLALVTTFDAVALSNLAPGPVRDWIVASGPATVVSGLALRRTEMRTLIDRVERTRDPDLAWLAAKVAERPRDRVRMAEIGMSSPGWRDELRAWLRAGQAGEIVRLWSVVEESRRVEVSALLVAGVRGSDDTSWIDRLVDEMSVDWQHSPVVFQEAAALWLARNTPDNPDIWAGVWSLYAEWNGTLPDLVQAARAL